MPMVHFERPALLVALAVVPVLGLLWRRACRGAAVTTTHLAGRDSSRANAARGLLRLSAVAALVVAAAGPVAFSPAEATRGAAPVVFVLDLSASMNAADVEPDRLTRARRAVEHICSLLPAASRTALISCAGDAVVTCPPTADRAVFHSLLGALHADRGGGGGTQLASGLSVASDLVERDGGPAAVVLVSDGEDHGPDPAPLARRMRRDGGIVHTVVVGSPEGVELRGVLLDEAVLTRARPERMARWAAAGGGGAWSVSPGRTALPDSPRAVAPRRLDRTAARRQGLGRGLSPVLCTCAALLLLGEMLLRGRSPAGA